MTAEERIEAKLDAVLVEFRSMKAQLLPEPKKPGYTVGAAAKILGVTRWTVQRWIRQNKLSKVKGRIPASQLNPYLS